MNIEETLNRLRQSETIQDLLNRVVDRDTAQAATTGMLNTMMEMDEEIIKNDSQSPKMKAAAYLATWAMGKILDERIREILEDEAVTFFPAPEYPEFNYTLYNMLHSDDLDRIFEEE